MQKRSNIFQWQVRLALSLVLILVDLAASAQTVSNVTAEQQANTLLIHYDLTTDSPCEVSLFVSLNSGKTWTGPLLRVSGDVGKDISSGNHTIRWEVLEEMENLVGSNIQFKVVANGKKIIEPEMVFVKGGKFTMGSNSGEDDERPVHIVTLNDFYIGKYEVTQAQWREVMGNNPSEFSGCDNCPVENVSWNDIQKFFRKLNRKTGKDYRLPTEAEWEYAANGGGQSKGYTYSGHENIIVVAWYNANSGERTHPVGQKRPNELGLYDMTGNVWEWCSDWYGDYPKESSLNPTGPIKGQYHVFRGGGWYANPESSRTTDRNGSKSSFKRSFVGFRLAYSTSR